MEKTKIRKEVEALNVQTETAKSSARQMLDTVKAKDQIQELLDEERAERAKVEKQLSEEQQSRAAAEERLTTEKEQWAAEKEQWAAEKKQCRAEKEQLTAEKEQEEVEKGEALKLLEKEKKTRLDMRRLYQGRLKDARETVEVMKALAIEEDKRHEETSKALFDSMQQG